MEKTQTEKSIIIKIPKTIIQQPRSSKKIPHEDAN